MSSPRSGIIATLLGGSPANGDNVQSQPLKFTGAAGIAGAMIAIAGAIPAVLKAVGWQDLSDAQLIGVLALVAAGSVAFAIASAGDALARAYSSAWTISKKDEVDAHPALQELVAAYAQRNGSGGATAARMDGAVVATSERIVVEDEDGRNLYVLAIQAAAGDRTRYLVAGPHQKPAWKEVDDVRFIGVAELLPSDVPHPETPAHEQVLESGAVTATRLPLAASSDDKDDEANAQ